MVRTTDGLQEYLDTFIHDKNLVTFLKIKGNSFSDMPEILKVTQKTFTERMSKECTCPAVSGLEKA